MTNTTSAILIVEPDSLLLHQLVDLLCRRGQTVYGARSESAARMMLAERQFDVFVCAAQLRNMPGVKLAREYYNHFIVCGTQIIMLVPDEQYGALCRDMGVASVTRSTALVDLPLMVERLCGSPPIAAV